MSIESFISQKFQNKYITNKLITDISEFNKAFGSIGIYIPSFLRELWEKPKSISTLLLNAEKTDIKNNIVNFIVHNLYDNISSLHNKDEQLIYIISLLLKQEINSLNNINAPFLDDSCCGIILKEFGRKKEVKFFFKKILLEIIKKLENDYSSDDIIFDPVEIINAINQEDEQKISSDTEGQLEELNEKYLFRSLNKENLEKEILNHKNNKEMEEYLNKIISEYNESPNRYSNSSFIDKIYSFDRYEQIMN